MLELHGQHLDRRALAERMGALSQVAGVRLVTLGDGVERGIRALEFRTGTGLAFSVLVDRALDIADCAHRGRAIGWHGPSGFRHPGLHEYEGEDGLAWTRSFSGLMATCGLDHILGPEEVPATEYNYPRRARVGHSLHGRISTIPARLTGYGEAWEGDACRLWAEGLVQQSTLFGENLHLHRRIEADLGGDEIRISDRVVNHGFAETPHMLFYHLNLGWPLLDEGARLLAPIREAVWASHAEAYEAQGVGYRRMPGPREGFREQVWEHETVACAEGLVPVALVNDRLGLGLEVVTRKDEFPCLYEWQNFQSGNYVLGIEPSTHHVTGDLAARERGEMIRLRHGEARDYHATLRVLDGAEAIAGAEERIAAIARQPEEDYPQPTGRFAPLRRGEARRSR